MKNKKIKTDFAYPVKIKKTMAGLLFCAMLLLVCSFAALSAKPDIKITSPTDGVSAGEVKILVEVTDFELADPKKTKQDNPGEGHIIYYLDVPVPTYFDHAAITHGGTYQINNATTVSWQNVTPGEHIFSAQLVNNSHKPLPTPAVDSVTITVGAPQGEPFLQIKTPQDGTDLPPGRIMIVVSVENFIISPQGMGAINRKGEGHLIYYIDQDPPSTQGEPAVTGISMVSVDQKYLWKSVAEGEHTFSAQLVNNDDTPLDPPVTAKITLNIKP